MSNNNNSNDQNIITISSCVSNIEDNNCDNTENKSKEKIFDNLNENSLIVNTDEIFELNKICSKNCSEKNDYNIEDDWNSNIIIPQRDSPPSFDLARELKENNNIKEVKINLCDKEKKENNNKIEKLNLNLENKCKEKIKVQNERNLEEINTKKKIIFM